MTEHAQVLDRLLDGPRMHHHVVLRDLVVGHMAAKLARAPIDLDDALAAPVLDQARFRLKEPPRHAYDVVVRRVGPIAVAEFPLTRYLESREPEDGFRLFARRLTKLLATSTHVERIRTKGVQGPHDVVTLRPGQEHGARRRVPKHIFAERRGGRLVRSGITIFVRLLQIRHEPNVANLAAHCKVQYASNMRIVHEIEGPMQVTASMVPLRGKEGTAKAANVELLACVDPNYVIAVENDEALYVEGDAAATIRMLEEWIRVIELNAEVLVEEGKLDAGWRDFDARFGAHRKKVVEP